MPDVASGKSLFSWWKRLLFLLVQDLLVLLFQDPRCGITAIEQVEFS